MYMRRILHFSMLKKEELMKKRIFALFLALTMLSGLIPAAAAEAADVPLDESHFPDECFRSIAAGFDTDGNGSLSKAEIAGITELNLAWKPISCLDGIEYLTGLTTLDAPFLQLKEVDLTQNTALRKVVLSSSLQTETEVDLTQNTALTELDISGNRLRSLDLTKNTQLQSLDCTHNPLTELDLSQNTLLEKLEVYETNLSCLDLLNHPKINPYFLEVRSCYRIVDDGAPLSVLPTAFDAERAINVTGGSLENGKIAFDPGSDLIAYDYDLDGDKGDFTGSFGLVRYAEDIPLDEAHFPDIQFREAVSFYADFDEDGMLSPTEVVRCENLFTTYYGIYDTEGIQYLKHLRKLNVDSKSLTELDLSGNTELQWLHCSYNRLRSLDLSKAPNLETLNCSDNFLTGLDLSGNTGLKSLQCDNNQLACLDLSANQQLTELSCTGNQSKAAPGTRVTDLPGHMDLDRVSEEQGGTLKNGTVRFDEGSDRIEYTYDLGIAIDGQPCRATFIIFNAQLDVPLDAAHFPDEQFREIVRYHFDDNLDGMLSVPEIKDASFLPVLDEGVLNLTGIEYLTELRKLDCVGTGLTELDLSRNTKLHTICCTENQLISLKLGEKPELEYMDCSRNRLPSLNVSQCPKLRTLECGQNHLTTLDLSQNPSLDELDCSNNRIEMLDLSRNPGITNLYCGYNSLACLDLTANTELKKWEACGCRALGAEGSLLKDLPGAPDPEKISDVKGGSFQDGKITFAEDSGEITYQYQVTADQTEEFALFRDRPAVPIDEAHFPDAAFRAWVSENTDLDHDSALSCAEQESVRIIEADHRQIGDLRGVEHFPNLHVLSCSENEITVLDLSGNPKLRSLCCSDNPLTELNPGQFHDLKKLNCSHTGLGSLDLSQNAALVELNCINNLLTELDLSQNPALKKLNCSENGIRKLNLSRNAGLTDLECSGSCLGTLDLTAIPGIKRLACSNCGLTELKLYSDTILDDFKANGNYLTGLERGNKDAVFGNCAFECRYNYYAITDETRLVDLPGRPATAKIKEVTGGSLEGGRISFDRNSTEIHFTYDMGNPYDSMEISLIRPAPESIMIDEEHFPDEAFRTWISRIPDKDGNGRLSIEELRTTYSMDVSGRGIQSLTGAACFTDLENLNCSGNLLTELDCSGMSELLTLDCSHNPLTELNLSGCKVLWDLTCSSCCLTTLNLTECPFIFQVDVANNQLTDLDLSGCNLMCSLWAQGNALTSLTCPALSSVNTEDNFYQITDEKTLKDLPGKPDPAKIKEVTGGSFEDGKIIFSPGSDLITYRYEINMGLSTQFCLKAPAKTADEHFTDISRGAWYFEAVDYAYRNGLFGGMSENTFEPETPMSRAMLVTVLWRMEGEPKEGENIFNDVPDSEWFTEPVAWAAKNKIVNGVGDGKFAPEDNITREQMAAILYRYADWKEIKTEKRGDLSTFPDASQVSTGWAMEPMQWAVGEGLIGGSDGKLLPQGPATRAQVATILMRFIENIE